MLKGRSEAVALAGIVPQPVAATGESPTGADNAATPLDRFDAISMCQSGNLLRFLLGAVMHTGSSRPVAASRRRPAQHLTPWYRSQSPLPDHRECRRSSPLRESRRPTRSYDRHVPGSRNPDAGACGAADLVNCCTQAFGSSLSRIQTRTLRVPKSTPAEQG